MLDLDKALETASPQETTVTLCLRGDLQLQYEDLTERLAEARRRARGGDSLAGDPEVRDLAEQLAALEADMAEHSVELTLRGLSNPRWQRLVNDNPPREDNAGDRSMGYNVDAFFPAMVRACLVGVSDEQWTRLYEAITSGQFERLSDAAVAVSRRRADVPKSPLVSDILQRSVQTSPSPGN